MKSSLPPRHAPHAPKPSCRPHRGWDVRCVAPLVIALVIARALEALCLWAGRALTLLFGSKRASRPEAPPRRAGQAPLV